MQQVKTWRLRRCCQIEVYGDGNEPKGDGTRSDRTHWHKHPSVCVKLSNHSLRIYLILLRNCQDVTARVLCKLRVWCSNLRLIVLSRELGRICVLDMGLVVECRVSAGGQ